MESCFQRYKNEQSFLANSEEKLELQESKTRENKAEV